MASVQINGLSPSTKSAPLVSGGPEAEAWGLPWSPVAHRYHRYFEMHDRSLWEQRGDEYVEFIRNCETPIYMQQQWLDIPASVEYPLERTTALIGQDYYNSSVAYMLALAILERRHMRIYGVDNATDEEWAFERPCNEYLIGVAHALGLNVWVHPDSSLLKHMPDVMYLDERQHYAQRYGFLNDEPKRRD